MCNQDGSDFSIMGELGFQTFYRSYELRNYPEELREREF